MPTVSFTYGEATITVRESLGRDVLDAQWLLLDLVEDVCKVAGIASSDALPPLEWGRVEWFIGMLLRSTVDGGLGLHVDRPDEAGNSQSVAIDWPTPNADRQHIYWTYQAILNSPARLVRRWRKAGQQADLEITDPEE